MRFSRRLKIGAGILLLILICLIWYMGLLPSFDGPARAGVRHALNLRVLPWGTSVRDFSHDAWTDEVIEVDLSLQPQRFEQFLKGRKFVPEIVIAPMMSDSFSRMQERDPFRVAEIWSWSFQDPAGGFGAKCSLYVSEKRDRMMVVYLSD